MRAILVMAALLLAGCADPLASSADAIDGHGAHDGHDAHDGHGGHDGQGHQSGAHEAGGGHGGHAGNSSQGHGSGGGHGGHADGAHAGVHDYDPHTDPHAGDHGQPGMQRPAFPPATGKVPSAPEAAKLPQVSMLRFIGDGELAKAVGAGTLTGSGTLADPYVIEGLYVTGDLMLQDTDACIVIRENWIGGQLSLNWNAQCVHVHHNHIYDLRVNENIRRTGYATGGLLERNLIEYVGQLRHYDGEFRHNTVGPMPEGGPFDAVKETTPVLDAEVLIANIDGFNQGLIHNNTFYGSVDLDFHGHHHGTGFFAPHSHYHGDEVEGRVEHEHDHRERWTSVQFVDNRIIDEKGYGLRYDDRNHAGDDRTAKSEQEEQLAEDHFHRTFVLIARNTIEGAGVWIDVFNADDQNHKARNDGWLDIQDNVVHLRERQAGLLETLRWNPTVGFDVVLAKEVELRMVGNHATFEPRPRGALDMSRPPATDGFRVHGLTDALLWFEGNSVDGLSTGLRAARFYEVQFVFQGNDLAGAKQPTAFDGSVP